MLELLAALELEVKEVTVLPDDEDFLNTDTSLLVWGFLAGVGSDVSDAYARRSKYSRSSLW